MIIQIFLPAVVNRNNVIVLNVIIRKKIMKMIKLRRKLSIKVELF
jgi:hypothetical protein